MYAIVLYRTGGRVLGTIRLGLAPRATLRVNTERYDQNPPATPLVFLYTI